MAKKYHLPLFLHSRAAHKDFVQILREEGYEKDGGKAAGGKGGVVHSFTGTAEEAADLVSTYVDRIMGECSPLYFFFHPLQMDMGFHVRYAKL